MNPTRSGWRAVMLSLVLGLLIVGLGPLLVAVGVYLGGPPRADPDPVILVILAGTTLGPGIVLGITARRARRVATQWDLGKVGGNILMSVALLIAALLGVAGLYAVVRLVKQAWPY